MVHTLLNLRSEGGVTMQVFKKILCPVDFSEYSVLALRYAFALSRENDASLVLLHSVPDLSQAISYLEGNYIGTVHEAMMSNAAEKLDQFSETVIHQDPDVMKIIERGSPSDAILKTAREIRADLIVMGTHGHSGYERFFLGSVTNKVLHKATLPVLIVCRPTHHFIHEGALREVEIKKILCPLDFEPSSKEVAHVALSIGRMYQSEITFFHSVRKQGKTESEDQEKLSMEKLREVVDPSSENWCKVRFQTNGGAAADEILNIIERDNIDLVVMGHHARRPIEELFLGSVAKRVVTDSRCPVLVARSQTDSPGNEITLI